MTRRSGRTTPASRSARAGFRRHVLEIEGELTIHTAADRRVALLAMLEADVELALDLSAVTELDTAGLQLLLLGRREAEHLGGRLTVSAVSQAVTDVLAIAHLTKELNDSDDLAEARR